MATLRIRCGHVHAIELTKKCLAGISTIRVLRVFDDAVPDGSIFPDICLEARYAEI